MGHDDLQHTLVFQPVAVTDQGAVEIGIKGIVPKVVVRRLDAVVDAALRSRGRGWRYIAHLFGCLSDLLAYSLADAVCADQPFADRYDADAQFLCNIRHAHSLWHNIPLFCR